MTKRHLGIILGTSGLLGIIVVLALDLVRHKPVGGPVQWAVLGGCMLAALLGAALIPLGDLPA